MKNMPNLKKQEVVKFYILLILALYLPLYHISKFFFEASIALLAPYLISNYQRQNKKDKKLLKFLAAIGLYCLSFLVAYILKKSNMDIDYAVNIIRIAIPLTIIYYAAAISSPISIKELTFTLSISLTLTFLMIIYPWYENNFSGRITLGTNLLLIYGTALSATIVLVFTTVFTNKNKSRALLILPSIALIMGMLALLASNAKGAILAAGTMLIIISCTQIKKPRSFFILMVLTSIISTGAYNHTNTRTELKNAYQQVQDYFSPQKEEVSGSQGYRLEMWRAALIKISDSPLAVNGNMKLRESFKNEIEEGHISSNIGHFKHVHNDYLQSWMSRGPIGIISLIFIIIIPITLVKTKNIRLIMFSFIGIYSLTGITSVPFLHIYSLRYYCLIIMLLLLIDRKLNYKNTE